MEWEGNLDVQGGLDTRGKAVQEEAGQRIAWVARTDILEPIPTLLILVMEARVEKAIKAQLRQSALNRLTTYFNDVASDVKK